MGSNGRYGNPNQLQRSAYGTATDIRNLGGLGNLAMQNAPNAIPLSSSYLQQPMGLPPIPARRNPMSSYGRMGMGMGSYYSPYSRYPTNMYTPGFGGGYRMSPYGPPETSSFMQMAEESTRPAFESIESVVEVVSSISMMLESTYHAVHSSYSAILGVVDQFSRLKDHLAQMLSILALLRGLRWLCLKFLYLLRLRKENPSEEAAWALASVGGQSNLPPRLDRSRRGSAWPFLMFVGLVIGAPWLMFKLLSKTLPKKPLDTTLFLDEQGMHVVAMAAFDFKATQSDELSFKAGEKLYLSPSYRCPQGWLYACNSKEETGLIPCTYLVVHPKKPNSRNVPQQQPPQGPIVLAPVQHFPECNFHPNNRAGNFSSQPNPVGNFGPQPNPVGNFGPQPNSDQNFGPQPNSVGNLSSPPSNLDYSRNPVQNPNIPPGDCLMNPGEGFSPYPDTDSNAGLSNSDNSKIPVQNPNIPPAEHSANPGGKLPGYLGKLSGYPGAQDCSKNPVGGVDSQPDCSRNSADSFSPRDCLQNGGNTPPESVSGSSKNSIPPSNDEVPAEVAKNQNLNTTEN